MSPTALLLENPQVISEQGRWYLSVPWLTAEKVHSQLHSSGCPSTLCLDPASREARLELWVGVEPAQVLAALHGCGAEAPPKAGV